MRVIDEFSFDEEQGKTHVKSNLKELQCRAEFHTDILLCGQSVYGGV